MKLNREVVIRIAEASIIETIEAFVRFRPGFHGDTGIRDYLYHRLMTGLPNGGTYTRPDGGGTLLAQAEWYTVLKYCNTGNGASRGRFDIGIADPGARGGAAGSCGNPRRSRRRAGDYEEWRGGVGRWPVDSDDLSLGQ